MCLCFGLQAVSACLPEETAKAQLLTAAHRVQEIATRSVNTSEQASYDAHLLDRISQESGNVDRAVEAYIAKLNEGPQSAGTYTNGELCEAILAALDKMKTTVGTSALIKDVRELDFVQVFSDCFQEVFRRLQVCAVNEFWLIPVCAF